MRGCRLFCLEINFPAQNKRYARSQTSAWLCKSCSYRETGSTLGFFLVPIRRRGKKVKRCTIITTQKMPHNFLRFWKSCRRSKIKFHGSLGPSSLTSGRKRNISSINGSRWQSVQNRRRAKGKTTKVTQINPGRHLFGVSTKDSRLS